jgi:rod shape-determining protein MreC
VTVFQRRRARLLLALLVAARDRAGHDRLPQRRGQPARPVRGVATAVLRPIQDGVDRSWSGPSPTVPAPSPTSFASAENRELRERVAVLEERRGSFEDLERENAELRDLLAIADRTELDTVTARVVALAPSNFEWTITIDVGTDDGVERGMPVIDGDGLVGRVIQVTPSASRVLLAIDPSFSAAARSAPRARSGSSTAAAVTPWCSGSSIPLATVEVGDRS